MTALGTDAPNVAGLVYIAAFGIDEGESLGALLSQGPVTPALAHLFTDKQGFGWLSEDDFVHHFAADVDPVQAKVMYAVQQPLAIRLHRRDGRPGLEIAAVLVPGRHRTTRRSRPTPSACSPAAWARPPSRSRRATWRWSPTPTRWRSSSRLPPPPCRQRVYAGLCSAVIQGHATQILQCRGQGQRPRTLLVEFHGLG
jgi:hypothetical protein